MSQNTFKPNYHFDAQRCRHSINGTNVVRHCYHFTNSMNQLAMAVEGEQHLKEAAESSFYQILSTYYSQQKINILADKLSIAEQYWQTIGMGKLQLILTDSQLSAAEMTHSHVDSGWKKAKGHHYKPINFIAVGFIAACAALFTDKSIGSYEITEIESIVMGNEKSMFEVKVKDVTHGN
jgi:hypothetical protein